MALDGGRKPERTKKPNPDVFRTHNIHAIPWKAPELGYFMDVKGQ